MILITLSFSTISLILISLYTFVELGKGFVFAHNILKIKTRKIGFIYIFTDIGQIIPVLKIGRTNNMNNRMSSYKTSAPFGVLVVLNIIVPNDVVVEKMFHDKFKRTRVSKSNEWFWLTPSLIITIIALKLIFLLDKRPKGLYLKAKRQKLI